jgi:glycerol-3-phosphate dehydrogenase (NAD(P)+)
MTRVGVVGTTSWGTTLAILLATGGSDVSLWARTDDEAARLRSDRENRRFVPGHSFPNNLSVTSSPDIAFGDSDLIVVAVPSRSLRDNIRDVRESINGSAVVVSATKGLEAGTSQRMSEVLAEELPESLHPAIGVLSGPNLAAEILKGKPTSTVVASRNAETAFRAQEAINSPLFRVYISDDVTGVELGGALKNIIALGAGICDGLGYGDNAKATIITRGLAEMARLGEACGATQQTFSGLAGMGDLIATCSSPLSRNHQVGERLAKGEPLSQIRASMDNVAEGIDTTAAAQKLANKLGVEMPITKAMHSVLFDGVPMEQARSDLLERAPGTE